ncbi:TOBE domain-containing protein [Methylocella sp.]|uniref:TOBE domain-containing protein n=1 Tax=Methylocella sp. TaxID=1978226 RepID=UPI003784FE35
MSRSAECALTTCFRRIFNAKSATFAENALARAPNEAFSADVALEDDRFERASALTAVVGREDPVYGLTELKHPAGSIWVAGAVRPMGRAVNISVRASDVILAVEPPKGLSPRNILAGAVLSIEADGGPSVTISLALEGGEKLAATATRKAVDELGLKSGELVFAMVKATALDERMMSAPIVFNPTL